MCSIYSYPVITVFSVIFVSLAAPFETGDVVDGKGNKFIEYIGEINGKLYFTDSTLMNWEDARNHCISYGLQLATITSVAEWNLLVSLFSHSRFVDYHWVALRDAHLPLQFSWDTLETEPSNAIGMKWGAADQVTGDYRTCAAFFSLPNGHSEMGINFCSSTLRVLCERQD